MKQEFRDLFEELPIGAVIVDPDESIRYANDSFSKYIGYDREELQELSLSDITVSYDGDELREGLEELYEGDRKYLEMETSYLRRDGKRVWGYPVRMLHPNPADDERDTILMLIVDITERRQIEHRMRQNEKLNALGVLAGRIAHDFNNILTVVKTFVGLLEAQPNDPEFIKDSIGRIQTATERGEKLTRQLLEYGRQEDRKVKTLEINEFIRESVEFYSRLLPPTIEIEHKSDDGDILVRIGEGQLDQVLMNLMLNARDAMEDRGKLTVETRRIHSDDPEFPRVQGLGEGEYASIRICDTGSGISPELMPRIFNPFFTTKGEEGTGVGLSTVYEIVERDRGYVRVESDPGEGSCFEVFLPTIEIPRRFLRGAGPTKPPAG